MLHRIYLSNGFWTFVSPEDIELSAVRWYMRWDKHHLYAYHPRVGLMHRVIANQLGWNLSGMHVHHIDGNGLNNLRENLKLCSPLEHAQEHGRRWKPPTFASQNHPIMKEWLRRH